MAAFMQRRCLSGAVAHTSVQRSVVQRAPLHVCASYKNKENINLTKVPALARHENDVGSTEVQVARLTARVQQISDHLKVNRKDYSGQRGLQLVLNQRRKLLQYLYKTDRASYEKVISQLEIRSVVTGLTQRAQERAAAKATKAKAAKKK